MFTFPVIEGNPDLLLLETNSIVLSKSFAKKIFGDIDPIGKSISSASGFQFIVTGIAENPPTNTKFKFDALLPVDHFTTKNNFYFAWDRGPEFETYVKIKNNVNPESLNSKFLSFFDTYIKDEDTNGYLQPIKDMHLHSSKLTYVDNAKRYSEIVLFAFISFFILFIAIINYVNLSTARSVKRAKEVGIKKVVGASRSELIRQFFTESYLVVMTSIILALILMEVILPSINDLLDEQLSLYNIGYQNGLLILLVFFIVAGSLSAFYPALFLSSFKPVKVLKGVHSANGKSIFRNGLVVFQFVISSILISCTIYSVQQLNFIENKNPGYMRENLLVVDLKSKILRQKHEIIKNEILTLAGVLNVAASSDYPGYDFTANGYKPEGMNDFILIKLLEVDPDYIKTMGMKIIEGRGFSNELVSDEKKYIINKTLADRLNWDKAVGKIISRDGKHSIIGVIDDFHFKSLQAKIEPLLLTIRAYDNYNYWFLNIKLDGNNNAATLKAIEGIMKATDETQTFNYVFMDEHYKQVYKPEIKFSKLFKLFSFLAIFIACLGLFGLAAYTAEQRTKEIGIRKVLGATPKQMLGLLSKQYFIIIILANTIAIPFAYYLLQSWQKGYAYHKSTTASLFVVTVLINLLIAAIIIYVQSVKTTLQNPVESLKCE